MFLIPCYSASIQTSFNFLLGTGGFSNNNAPFAECSGQLTCTNSSTASTSGTYNLFNPALGTLTGVTVDLVSTLPVGTEILGTGSGGTATATGDAAYSIGTFFSGDITAPSSSCSPFCNVFTPNGTQDFAVNGHLVVAGSLNSFIGVGTDSASVSETLTVNGSATNGGIIARTRANELGTLGWRGTVTITYDYAVPEPSTMSHLFGAGLLFGWSSRRRISFVGRKPSDS